MFRSKTSSFMAAMLATVVLNMAVSFRVESTAQDSLSDPVVTQSVVMGEPTAKSLAEFRKAVLATAESQVKAKELSRLDLIRLRIATMHKPTLEKMHQSCAEQVLVDGAATSYGAIDWAKLAVFIKEMIPIILELIKLFAYQNYGSQYVCELVPTGFHYYSPYVLAA